MGTKTLIKGSKVLISLSFLTLISCGGGGGNGSGIYGKYESSLVGILSIEPIHLSSDVVIWRDIDKDGTCDTVVFKDDSVNATIYLEPIKTYNGTNVTNNISPVYIDRYTIYFYSSVSNNNCERFEECRQIFHTPFVNFTSITLTPDQNKVKVSIPVVLASWKSNTLINYCSTLLDNCIYNAVIELRGREIYSGKSMVIRGTFSLQIADYIDEDDKCRRELQ